jgi:N-glycosylase/DNA lyase
MNDISRENHVMSTDGAVPERYREHWERHRDTIDARIAEFESVPRDEYFFELLYCLLTPQSRAAHAERAIALLRDAGFPDVDVDPVPILRDPAHYIRFHNQKGKRVLALRDAWERLDALIAADLPSRTKRDMLAAEVNGLGMKEASHFLRNIGRLDLAIIDRHILTHMMACGTIEEIPRSISPARYRSLEESFESLAHRFGLSMQQLDLLFWSFEEGSVRK